MKITLFLDLINERVKTKKVSFLSDKQKLLDKRFNIGSSIEKISNNLIGTLQGFANENKELFEGRNDIKLIILASAIRPPTEFRELKINEENKSHLINYLIGKKPFIKLKKDDDFSVYINSRIDKTFNKEVLSFLVSGNLAVVYSHIMNSITKDIDKNFGKLEPAEERTLKTNIQKRIAEELSIKMIAPDTSTKPKVSGGSYYSRHPRGVGKFPDFQFHFGTKENEDALQIRKDFGIKTSSFYIEAKNFNRIVGKQTRPERFKKDIDDEKLFNKLTSLRTGEVGSTFTGEEIKKLLKASSISLRRPIVYLNILGKTKRTKAKTFENEISDEEKFSSKRTSPGQIGFFKGDKKFFGFEIGSVAYKKGLFKESILEAIKENAKV